MSRIIKKAKMKKIVKTEKRFFIVAPQHEDDFVYQVCSTTSHGAFLEIYWADSYEAIYSCDSLKDAKKFAEKKIAEKKCKRVKVI